MSDAESNASPFNNPAIKAMFLSFQSVPGYNYRDTFFAFDSNFEWLMPLNTITQGTSQGTRVGTSCRLLGFELFFGAALQNDTDVGFSRQIRILAVFSQSGKLPQVDDILSGAQIRCSPYNLENVPSEYQILMDYTLPPQFLDGLALNKGEFFYKYLTCNHVVRFPKTGQTTSSENISGSVYFLIMMNTNSSITDGTLRVHYAE